MSGHIVGLRVVRGPDWKWAEQDGGEGFVGTVVEVGKHGSPTSPDKTVVVQWDGGNRTNYRTGYLDAYDLYVFDNASVGVVFRTRQCDACQTKGFPGFCWTCSQCEDFDLCTNCYMSGKHDLTHSFNRIAADGLSGTAVSPREGSVKHVAKGIYVGAVVKRGPDWDWDNQDGGEEGSTATGTVTCIRGWDQESAMSVACVKWMRTGQTNVYRVGHKGKVDLKCVQEGIYGNYYPKHLPVLGKEYSLQRLTLPTAVQALTDRPICQFKPGDYVRVELDLEILKALQEGHGGWNPKMALVIGMIGVVHRVTEKNDVRVSFEEAKQRWTFHPAALKRIETYHAGQLVRIVDDMETVQRLQIGHGEWTEAMAATLGEVGKVVRVYQDMDLRIHVKNSVWTYNPRCVQPLQPNDGNNMQNNQTPLREMSADRGESSNNENGNNDNSNDSDVKIGSDAELAEILARVPQLLNEGEPEGNQFQLVQEAAQGRDERVREILAAQPHIIDIKVQGKTALQVASHQGFQAVVEELIKAGADLEIKDDDGDNALHYAAFGNEPGAAMLLIENGADINASNGNGCTALHVAANKGHRDMVSCLIDGRADLNLKDAYGDTPLHDAIAKERNEIVKLLIDAGADLQIPNDRGFNALHHGALKGNSGAVQFLVEQEGLVDIKKEDGFSALHLAALNNHKSVAEIMIKDGNCDINIRNGRLQTPLILAVSQGHTAIVELLVEYDCEVDARDEEGDTALHLALVRQSVSTDSSASDTMTRIRTHLGMESSDGNTGEAIACFLAQAGASLIIANNKNKTPLDLCADPKLRTILQEYSRKFRERVEESETPVGVSAPDVLCTLCEEAKANLEFGPCGHVIMCAKCGERIKKCLECKQIVESRKIIDNDPQVCMICSNDTAEVVFQPCGHKVSCSACARRTKKCIACKSVISKKTGLKKCKSSTSESEIAGGEASPGTGEEQNCGICLENPKNVAFMCGHRVCDKCAPQLRDCPMCRVKITHTIRLY
ncbi:hypothetical protein ACHWQZ_G006711 [Mnemiopsis leidyi]